MPTYQWRGPFDNAAVNQLHAEGFDHRVLDDDWWTQVNEHSLGWVCAWENEELVGFVNLAWDGATHAFILDTLVTVSAQRGGVGAELVATAVREAAEPAANGCMSTSRSISGRSTSTAAASGPLTPA